jgi:hypothetical protein
MPSSTPMVVASCWSERYLGYMHAQGRRNRMVIL